MKTPGIYTLLLLMLFSMPAFSQFGSPPDGEPRERLAELRRLKMIEALDLTEEQAVRLTVREKNFREEEANERQKREALLEQLRAQLKDNAETAALRATLEQFEQLSVAAVTRKHQYLRSLSDFLSEEQIAKLVLFEHHFAKEIRRILGNSRRGRPPKR
jgi:Spy/CpxP family protein refolding chaperone